MRSARRNNFAAGFTLIELILSMMMVAILSLSLYATLNTAYKAKAAADRAIVPIRAVGIAADIIENDLQSVVKPNSYSIGSQAVATNDVSDGTLYLSGAFTGWQDGGGGGAADGMEFYTNESDGRTDDLPLYDGIRRIDILLRTDVTPPVLVRRITRNLLSPTLDSVPPEEEVLCRNVQSFTLEYFDGTDFYETWDPTQMDPTANPDNFLPMLVRMTLVVNLDDPTQTPNPANPDANTYRIVRSMRIPIGKPQPLQ
jgi:prepilin-type N-terminal cleavage/methylation domain-containing protein